MCIRDSSETVRDGSRSTLAGFNDVRRMNGALAGCLSNAFGAAASNDNRKLKNRNKVAKRVRVRRRESIIGDATTSLDASTKVVPDVVAQLASAPSKTETTEIQANNVGGSDRQTSSGGPSTFPPRRCSSLQELPRRTSSSQSQAAGRGGDGSRRGTIGRRASRLDRHVYQCYLAGILHSSRRSERFVRLQQLYAVLENVVEIETEMTSLRRGAAPTATDVRGRQPPALKHATDSARQKLWRQRSLDLQKLYAKLDAAQDDKEFFYDSGHLDAYQWKLWKDLGLNRKSTSLTKLRDLFEAAAVFHGRTTITTPTSSQSFDRGLSYKKLLGTFQNMEKKTRKETDAWLRRQSSSRRLDGGGPKLDGTYMKMMESAAKNAKTLALHGYYMNEHRNRYDAYVQSRRIYRPTSAPNIFEQLGDDDESDEVASSDRTTSIAGFYDSTRCGSERTAANPASDSTDSLQIFSPVTSASRAPIHSASIPYQDSAGYPSEQQSCSPVGLSAAASELFTEEVSCDIQSAQQEIAADDDRGDIVNELDADVKHGGRSRTRKRHRPRCRNGNETVVQRTDARCAVPGHCPSSAARRHIDAWRRSSRPLSGTLNQALAYFNSLCIDDSADKNDRSTPVNSNGEAAVSANENYDSRAQINSADVSNNHPTFMSTENGKIPAAKLADREKKFSSEIKLDVNGSESTVVPDRRKIVLPQLCSSRDGVRAADFSKSNVSELPLPTCLRAVNIDKRRSKLTIDSTGPNCQRRGGSTKARIADVRPCTTRSDVAATPEVFPTYVRPGPVVRMLSESQTTSVSAPMFLDCRRAVVRKLPTFHDRSRLSCDPPMYGDSKVSPATKLVTCTNKFSSGKSTNSDSPSADDEPKQMVNDDGRLKIEASEADVDASQKSGSSEDLCPKNAVMYVTAVDSSSFVCGRCCRLLVACNCASPAETSSMYVSEKRSDDKNYVGHRCSNESGKSAPLKSNSGSFMPAASRCGRDMDAEPASLMTVDSPYKGPRTVTGDGRGRQDVELRQMMDSLETIDSEWTSGRPTRSTQQIQSTSDVNNNTSSSQGRRRSNCRVTGHLGQREIR